MSNDSSVTVTELAVPKTPTRLTNRPQAEGHRVPVGYISVPTPVETPSYGRKPEEKRTSTPPALVLPPINPHQCPNCHYTEEPPRAATPEVIKRPGDVKKTSVLYAINDLVHLLGSKHPDAEPNVKFVMRVQFPNKPAQVEVSESFHSFILVARSAWFRRSWRAFHQLEKHTVDPKYNFSSPFNERIHKFDIGIELAQNQDIPQSISKLLEFSLVLTDCTERDFEDIRKALKQFKNYLYTGNCEISEKIVGYLASLAHAFLVDSLKEFISEYHKAKFEMSETSPSSCDAILEQLEIAHNYEMTSLRDECIRLVNLNALQIINSAKWQKIADKYPELVLITFNKNA